MVHVYITTNSHTYTLVVYKLWFKNTVEYKKISQSIKLKDTHVYTALTVCIELTKLMDLSKSQISEL